VIAMIVSAAGIAVANAALRFKPQLTEKGCGP